MHELPEIVKDIVVVRHGQSCLQSGGTVEGEQLELSELGRKQMETVKDRLNPHTFDLVYVSPLPDAYQSYQIASPKAFQVELDSRIVEDEVVGNWHQSVVECLPTGQFSCRFGDGWLIPCAARAGMIAEDIAASGAERILLFAHQGIIKHLIAAWLGIDGCSLYRNLILDNASFTGLSLDKSGNRLVQYVNDSRHLPDELRESQCLRSC